MLVWIVNLTTRYKGKTRSNSEVFKNEKEAIDYFEDIVLEEYGSFEMAGIKEQFIVWKRYEDKHIKTYEVWEYGRYSENSSKITMEGKNIK